MRHGHLREPVVGLAINHGPLFNPADLALVCLDLQEPPPMLQHLERLPIRHLGNTFRDRGYAIVQIHLPRRNINRLIIFVMESVAPGRKPYRANTNKQDRPQHGHVSREAPN